MGTDSDGNPTPHSVGVHRRPFQGLHSAHRPSDDEIERLDLEMVEQAGLEIDHVPDRDPGKFVSVPAVRARS